MASNNAVTITLSGQGANTALTGWQSVRITTGIEVVPPSFQVTYTESLGNSSTSVVATAGQACTVSIGSTVVITGYVDRVIETIAAEQHQLTLTGRGKTQDLVDCSAVWKSSSFNNQNALQIAQSVAQAYSITVATTESGLPVQPTVTVNLGETAFNLIDRVCKYSGLLAYEKPDGSLLLTRVSTTQAGSGFEQGTNVQAASFMQAMDQRYSEYDVYYPGTNTLQDQTNVVPYTYKDTLVPRKRVKYVEFLANAYSVTQGQAQATWEANRRIGRSQVVTVTVDSWSDESGNLWTPNTLAMVNIPAIKIANLSLLIGEVTFVLDLNGGTYAEITLMPPQAFSVEPLVNNPVPLDVVQQPGSP